MKTLKFLLITSILFFLSCGKDDDNQPDTEPQEITIPLTVDFDALLDLPAGSEASAVVNFGQASGITNEEFTTIVNLNDKINWKLESNSSPNDVILFDAISIVGGALWVADSNYFELTVPPNPSSLPYKDYEIKINKSRENEDVEVKYNINFYAERDGVRSGPYFVDPKIQIRRSN